jgi:hypothetical protein
VHTLTALVLAVPGQPAPSLAEIAATPGLAATFVVAAGTAGELHRRGQLVEALRLRSAVLLLFEDPCEASEFEKAVADARAAAHRQKGKMLGPAWRRRHPLSASPGGAG